MTNIKNISNINCFDPTITSRHINSFYPTTNTHTLEYHGKDSYILQSHQEWIDEEIIHCFCAQNEYLFPYKTWGETVVGLPFCYKWIHFTDEFIIELSDYMNSSTSLPTVWIHFIDGFTNEMKCMNSFHKWIH